MYFKSERGEYRKSTKNPDSYFPEFEFLLNLVSENNNNLFR